MGLFDGIFDKIIDTGVNVKYGVGNIGDSMSHNYYRAKNNLSGTFSGVSAYYRLRQNARNFLTRELFDQMRVNDDIKKICRLSRHIQHFSEHSITKLFVRYTKKPDPRRFEQQINKLVLIYSNDLREFTTSYSDFLKYTNDMLVIGFNMQSAENSALTEIALNFATVVEEKKSYIPIGIINKFDEKCDKLRALQEAKIHQMFQDSLWMQKRGQVKRLGIGGWLWKSIGGSLASHKIKRLIKRFRHREVKDLRTNFEKMQADVESKNVDLTFMVRLLKHMDSLVQSIVELKELNHDIKIMLSIVEKNYKAAEESIAKFIGIFHDSPALKQSGIVVMLKKLEENHANIKKIIEEDVLDEEKLKKILEGQYNDLKGIGNLLVQHSQKVISEIISDPNKYIKNPSNS